MKTYLMYSNENTGVHLFERHGEGDIEQLKSDPKNKEWNKCMNKAHALFRLANLVGDKKSLHKMEIDLDEWFVK